MAIKYSFLLKSSMVVLGLVFAAGFDTGHALAKVKDKEMKQATEEKVQKAAEEKVKAVDEAKWEAQAEKSFGVGKGVGKKLMTKEEWREHQRKMQSMTPEEKEAYRKEVHQSLMDRAKEKGIAMPEKPGPHGRDGMMDGKGMKKGKTGGISGGGAPAGSPGGY